MGLIEHWTIDHFTVGTPKSAHQRGWNEGVEQVWRDEVEPLRRQLARAVEKNERLRETLGLIATHARLDIKERGIEEARRYLLLAEDALNAR